MRSAFRNKLKGGGGSSTGPRVVKPVLPVAKKLATNKENDPS